MEKNTDDKKQPEHKKSDLKRGVEQTLNVLPKELEISDINKKYRKKLEMFSDE